MQRSVVQRVNEHGLAVVLVELQLEHKKLPSREELVELMLIDRERRWIS